MCRRLPEITSDNRCVQIVNDESSTSVVVFGASRGIGAAVAERFAANGHKVVGTHRGSGVPIGVTGLEADVRSEESIASVLEQSASLHGPVQTVVICAGITRDGLLLRQSNDDWNDVIETNLTAPRNIVKAILPVFLRQRGGSVVIVGSVSGMTGHAGQANYTAAKAGLIGFTKTIAREYGKKNIRINVVAPGPTDTDMVAAVTDKELEAMINEIPLGRLARPTEIADVVYAVSGFTFMTGAIVPVAGGAGLGY